MRHNKVSVKFWTSETSGNWDCSEDMLKNFCRKQYMKSKFVHVLKLSGLGNYII